ncbi:hypothetical protein MKEN_01203300 [Mycena kentingensis (nom. inval.)]|nr:hypothetical protein MKEN_01203300 [Mycena kentingensis (nom. inval.)]
MPSYEYPINISDAPLLSDADHDFITGLGNLMRDAKHENTAAHDSFLVEQAKRFLVYRPQLVSFAHPGPPRDALNFLRHAMVRNGFRKDGPFGAIFYDLLGFAQEANRVHGVLRDRKLAADDRRRNAAAAAARAERLEALDYAARLAAWQAAPLPNSASEDESGVLGDDEDAISLGSVDEDTLVDVVEDAGPASVPDDHPAPTPESGSSMSSLGLEIDSNLASTASGNSPLSPIEDYFSAQLNQLMRDFRLTPTLPATPPPSPHPSLPELITASSSTVSLPLQERFVALREPCATYLNSAVIADGHSVAAVQSSHRRGTGRVPMVPAVSSSRSRPSSRPLLIVDGVPLPTANRYVDDLPVSMPTSNVFRASGSGSHGSSKRSKTSSGPGIFKPLMTKKQLAALARGAVLPMTKGQRSAVDRVEEGYWLKRERGHASKRSKSNGKRCYFCSNPGHLIARCPGFTSPQTLALPQVLTEPKQVAQLHGDLSIVDSLQDFLASSSSRLRSLRRLAQSAGAGRVRAPDPGTCTNRYGNSFDTAAFFTTPVAPSSRSTPSFLLSTDFPFGSVVSTIPFASVSASSGGMDRARASILEPPKNPALPVHHVIHDAAKRLQILLWRRSCLSQHRCSGVLRWHSRKPNPQSPYLVPQHIEFVVRHPSTASSSVFGIEVLPNGTFALPILLNARCGRPSSSRDHSAVRQTLLAVFHDDPALVQQPAPPRCIPPPPPLPPYPYPPPPETPEPRPDGRSCCPYEFCAPVRSFSSRVGPVPRYLASELVKTDVALLDFHAREAV